MAYPAVTQWVSGPFNMKKITTEFAGQGLCR